jgi:D-psicose/D-tagatose/L-ribulose 3-epimerase
MKLGVNTFIWSAEFGTAQLPLLPRIKAHGFDGVEVPMFEPAHFPAADIRRGVEANGLECTVCSIIPQGRSLISDDPEVRRRTRQHLRDAIEATAEVGARLIDGPLYSPVGYLPGRRRTPDEWRWAIEGYQSVTATLEACGVALAIEPLNRFETYFLNTAADAAALCDAVGHPRVGVAFDTFHANIEEKDLAGACRLLGPRVLHVQISGKRQRHAGQRPHRVEEPVWRAGGPAIRRLADDRKLRALARRVQRGGRDLARHRADAGCDRL